MRWVERWGTWVSGGARRQTETTLTRVRAAGARLHGWNARVASPSVKGDLRRCFLAASLVRCWSLVQAPVAGGSASLQCLAAARRVFRVLLVNVLLWALGGERERERTRYDEGDVIASVRATTEDRGHGVKENYASRQSRSRCSFPSIRILVLQAVCVMES